LEHNELAGWTDKKRRWGLTAFLAGLGTAAAFMIPLMIYNGGYFVYTGDFNVQQIPFYMLAHDAVRSGNVMWSWTTDLGANFVGSYSFYLLFSPFFWLTLPFPTSFVPHLMGPLIVLKTALASLFAYMYIKRFTKRPEWAVIGGLLYAFSGFMTFNIFFNHFHEVALFFPLLLISLEEAVVNDRRGVFALTAALCCMVNYWFFIGEVMFVLIYIAVRSASGWGMTARKFGMLTVEALLGVGLAAVFLIPSVLAITGNPRTGQDSLLTGWLMWIYGWNQRLPAIITSFFFPPESPSHANFFPEMGAKWSSLSAWLPMFSAVGVIAYCKARKNDFFKRIIITSMIISLVPLFNSVFVLFNSSYYARWFNMPVLMMCAATACSLEERDLPEMRAGWISGLRWVGGYVAVVVLAVGLSPVIDDEGALKFGLYEEPIGFLMGSLFAAAGLALTFILVRQFEKPRFYRTVSIMLCAFIPVFTLCYIGYGKQSPENDAWLTRNILPGRYTLSLDDSVFARSDFYNCMDNLGMFWDLPNIQAFHSIVPPSVMEFYPEIGVKRDVNSKPGPDDQALRALLSVRYLFIATNEENQEPTPGFSRCDVQLGYNIYQNDNFIPMGFGYDEVFARSQLEQLSKGKRTAAMLSSLCLEDEAVFKYSDIARQTTGFSASVASPSRIAASAEARRRLACASFDVDNGGFSARSDFDRDMLVFFSVPYDKGWRASVNGVPVGIEKANVGFMAIRVPAGRADIRFDYRTPGLGTGAVLSCICLLLFGLYIFLCRRLNARSKKELTK